MTEWKLFEQYVPEPAWCLIGRPWMSLERQPGFAARARLVTDLVADLVRSAGLAAVASISDLGCGDGSLLARLRDVPGLAAIPMWGYDLGAADVAYGQGHGLDVRLADIVQDRRLKYGQLVIASEVVEHLADPEGFLRGLPGKFLIISSPSAETGAWHNSIHAWAWDMPGYADLVRRAGWTVVRHAECEGGLNTFAGATRSQRFQAILAVR